VARPLSPTAGSPVGARFRYFLAVAHSWCLARLLYSSFAFDHRAPHRAWINSKMELPCHGTPLPPSSCSHPGQEDSRQVPPLSGGWLRFHLHDGRCLALLSSPQPMPKSELSPGISWVLRTRGMCLAWLLYFSYLLLIIGHVTEHIISKVWPLQWKSLAT